MEDHENIYLFLEEAQLGNLFQWIKKNGKCQEDEAAYFFIQTLTGFYYLHKNGYIHRDLKPENLLLFDSEELPNRPIVKVCDFTWAAQMDKDSAQERTTHCGTYEYMAPEMLKKESHDFGLDVWSLGILLYELAHGRAPY